MTDPRDRAPAPPAIPDLDLPPRKVSTPRLAVPVVSAPPAASADVDLGGMPIERSVTAPPASGAPQSGPRREVAISIEDDDPLGMEIERTGQPITMATAHSRRPATGGASASGLEVAYQRSDLERAVAPAGPSALEVVGSYAVPITGFAVAAAALLMLAHHPGGRPLLALSPRAFDASSASASGAVAIGAFVVAILLGYAGLKVRPRSYAILVASATMLLASLAMVTVTLVATDEHPSPPDGALLVPYLVPASLLALALGLGGRGIALFRRGGLGRRLLSPAVAAIGGAMAFGALELSRFGSLF